MQQYTITPYTDYLSRATRIMPSNRHITLADLQTLSDDDMIAVQIYFYFTFPSNVMRDNYEPLRKIKLQADIILQTMPDNSVIIAPGDIPYMYLRLIDLIYCSGGAVDLQGPGVYSYTDPVTGAVINKNLTFKTFPLSPLTPGLVATELLDTYLYEQLADVNLNNLLYLGFNLGSVHDVHITQERIQSLYGIPTFQLKNFDIYDVWVAVDPALSYVSSYNDLISNSRETQSNCQPEYNVGHEFTSTNFLRCNIKIAITYWIYQNRLDVTWSPIHLTMINNLTLSMTVIDYYDPKISDFNKIYFRVRDIEPDQVTGTTPKVVLSDDDEIIGDIVPQSGHNFTETVMLIKSVRDLRVIDFPLFTQEQINKFTGEFIEFDLVNSAKLRGFYSGPNKGFYTGSEALLEDLPVTSISPFVPPHTTVDVLSAVGTVADITYLDNGSMVTKSLYLREYNPDFGLIFTVVWNDDTKSDVVGTTEPAVYLYPPLVYNVKVLTDETAYMEGIVLRAR